MDKRMRDVPKFCIKHEDCNLHDPETSNLEYCELPTGTCLPCFSVCFEESLCKEMCPAYYRDVLRQQRTHAPKTQDSVNTSPSSSIVFKKLVVLIGISSLTFILLVLLIVAIAVKFKKKRASSRRLRNLSHENAEPNTYTEAPCLLKDEQNYRAHHRERTAPLSSSSDRRSLLPPELPGDDESYQFPNVDSSLEESYGDNDSSNSGGRFTPSFPALFLANKVKGSSIEYPIKPAREHDNCEFSFGVLEFTEQLYNTYITEIVKEIQGYEDSKLQDGQAVINVNPANAYSALHALRYGNLSYYKHLIVPSPSPEREMQPPQFLPNDASSKQGPSNIQTNDSTDSGESFTSSFPALFLSNERDKCELSFGVFEFTEQLYNAYITEIVKRIQGYEDSILQDGQAVIKVNPANVYSASHTLRYGNLGYYKHLIVPFSSPKREMQPPRFLLNGTNSNQEPSITQTVSEVMAESSSPRPIEPVHLNAKINNGEDNVERRAIMLLQTPTLDSPQPDSRGSNRRYTVI